MQQIIIGNKGQIGSALQAILQCDGVDREELAEFKKYDVMHVAIPFSNEFIDVVEGYKALYAPDLVVIHSTVPVGISRQLDAVHSPCRGVHPNLEEGIRTFIKFFGGERSEEASRLFADLGIPVQITNKAENTEAMKLWDTTIYGANIILEKEIAKYCVDHDLDLDIVYTQACSSYNDGYEALGHPEYKKYVLRHTDGKIGGHCVIPNLALLNTDFTKWLEDYNSKR